MSKQNFRAIHEVIEEVTLNKVDIQGSSRPEIPNEVRRNNIDFYDHKAVDVYVRDNTLELLKNDTAVRSIGSIREIRYRNLDEFKKAL